MKYCYTLMFISFEGKVIQGHDQWTGRIQIYTSVSMLRLYVLQSEKALSAELQTTGVLLKVHLAGFYSLALFPVFRFPSKRVGWTTLVKIILCSNRAARFPLSSFSFVALLYSCISLILAVTCKLTHYDLLWHSSLLYYF